MRNVSIALVASLVISSVAMAGPLVGYPLAYDGWTGSVLMDSGSGLTVNVDYCVYGPGNSPWSDPNFTPAANQFTYVYQAYSTGTIELNSLTIGMLDSNEAQGIGSIDLGTSGVAPASAAFGNVPPNLDSANWSWASLGGLTNQHSSGMVYYSVNEPLWWFGSIKNDTQTASGFLPSPSDVIPEPATLSLLLAGAVLGLRRRKR